MRRGRLAALLLGAGLAACGARTALFAGDLGDAGPGPADAADASAPDSTPAPPPPHDAMPDVVIDPICAAVDGGLPDGATCRRMLVVGDITMSMPSCFVDVVVAAGEEGELFYACDGGVAEAVFDGGTFRGRFDGRWVNVCSGTSFDFRDGCRWNSSQRIQGDLASGELRFDYTEAPAPGAHGCLVPCTAAARVLVE